MTGWICKRCETGNDAALMAREVCDSPLLYTHEELEGVMTRRVNEVREEAAAAARVAAVKAAAAAKSAASASVAPPPPASSGDSCAVWALVLLLTLALVAVLYVAIFVPALWSEIRSGVLLAYNDLLLKLQQ